MARKVTTEFIDDIDGGAAERTFTFAVDGTNYEIDLSANNIAEFKQAIGGFIESARKASAGRRARRSANRGSVSREQSQAIRDWARQNGYDIAPRGRIKTEVVDAFNATHQGSQLTAVG